MFDVQWLCACAILSLDMLHLSCVMILLCWDEISFVSICFSHAWRLHSSLLYMDWESLLPNALLLNSALFSLIHSHSFVLIWSVSTASSSWSCSSSISPSNVSISSIYLFFFSFSLSFPSSGSWVIACFLLCYWWVLMLLHQLQSHSALLHCRIGL